MYKKMCQLKFVSMFRDCNNDCNNCSWFVSEFECEEALETKKKFMQEKADLKKLESYRITDFVSCKK